ncbi:hypothetical protein BH10PSE18_BH10PSE18_30650 [soil metagenome]
MKIGDHRLSFHRPGNPIEREPRETGILRSTADRAAAYLPFKLVRQQEIQARHPHQAASFVQERDRENWRNSDDGSSIFSAEDPSLAVRCTSDVAPSDGSNALGSHQDLTDIVPGDVWDRRRSEDGSGDFCVDGPFPTMENTFDPTLAELSALAVHWKTDDLASVHAVLCSLNEDLKDIPTDASKIYLSRKTPLKYCDMGNATISNHPNPVARVHEHAADGGPPLFPGGGVDYSLRNQPKTRIPGINFLISIRPFIANDYGDLHQKSESIIVTLEDALKNGKIFKDATAVVGHAVVVNAREPIPFALVL